MKNLSSLFIALALLLTSCTSDDSSSSKAGDIVGIWHGLTLDYSGKTVTSAQGQSITSDFNGEAYDMDYTLTFTKNPNVVVSEGDYSLELTTTVLGQTTIQNLENIEFIEADIWSRDGNILRISDGTEFYDYTIIELTENMLKLSIITEEDLSQQGATIISTINATLTLTR